MSAQETADRVDAGPAGEQPEPGPTGPTGPTGLARRCSRRAGRLPLRWRVAAMTVLGAAAAASCLAAVRLATAAQRDAEVAQAQFGALPAASADIQQILSYDYRQLGADLARARADTTGEFRGEFGVLASQLIGPAAAQQHTVTRASVPDAAVVTATPGRAVVLLFVDQVTTSKARPQPQLAASQLRVTVLRVGGRWLVEQFQAL